MPKPRIRYPEAVTPEWRRNQQAFADYQALYPQLRDAMVSGTVAVAHQAHWADLYGKYEDAFIGNDMVTVTTLTHRLIAGLTWRG